MGNWPTQPPLWPNTRVTFYEYQIYSRDPADTAALRDTYQSYGVMRSPAFMRDTLGIDETAIGWEVDNADRWISFPFPPHSVARDLTGAWLPPVPIQQLGIAYPPNPSFPGNPYWYPPISLTLDYNQDWIFIPAHPSVPVWGPGTDSVIVWVGTFLSAGGNTSEDVPPPASLKPIRPFRWFEGFEAIRGGESTFAESPEGMGGTAETNSRFASRTPDGLGMSYRETSDPVTHVLDENISPVVNPTNSWERFYFTLRKVPAATLTIWAAEGSAANSAILLRLNTSGQLEIWTRNNVSTLFGPLATTSALTIGTRVRIDLYAVFRLRRTVGAAGCETTGATNGNQGFLEVYINNALAASANGSCHDGSGATTVNHSQSTLGPSAANVAEFDFDDWHNVDPGNCDPLNVDFKAFQSTLPWFYGTHAQLIKPTAFIANANWTGDFRVALQNPSIRATGTLVSTTSGARLELATEADNDPINGALSVIARQMGYLAFNVGYANQRVSSTVTGRIGFTMAGGADVFRTLSENNTLNGYNFLKNVASDAGAVDELPALNTVEPITIIHTKSTDAVQDNIREFQLVALFMGVFGPEDAIGTADAPGITDLIGIHNAPFVSKYLGRATPPIENSVGVASTTYTGNSTGQDITVDLPAIHFVCIRNTTTGDMTWWWSSMLGPHKNASSFDIVTGNTVQVLANDDGTCSIRLAGADAAANQTGITYHLLAYCDIMSRAMLNTAQKHATGTTVNPYFDTEYTGEAAFFALENNENALSGDGLFHKGPANASNAASEFNAAEVAAAIFNLGAWQSGGALNTGIQEIAANFWRQTTETLKPVIITSYIGDGAGGTRSLTVDLGGRRPLWAYVQGTTGAGFVRDASHTTNNSTRADGAAGSTTAIVGGAVNTLQVGTALNTNLVAYSVFIIPSCSDTAGNAGWGVDDVCGLLEPGWLLADLPPWILTEPPIPDTAIVGEGGLILSGAPSMLLIKDMSGIYTLVPGKTNDTVYDRQTGQTSVDLAIPAPTAKTGFV